MLLDRWEEELLACYRGQARHPVFVALEETIEQCQIPPEPFLGFDYRLPAGPNENALPEFCRGSGLLPLFGQSGRTGWSFTSADYRDPELQRLSDFTCTALQLANFWQDVARDFRIGRIYLPLEDMARHGYSERRSGGLPLRPEVR